MSVRVLSVGSMHAINAVVNSMLEEKSSCIRKFVLDGLILL